MIHEPAKDRVMKPIEGEGLLGIFEALAEEAEKFGNEVGQCCMPYIKEGDEFKEGEWVPELWFVVRKVLNEESN
jgi:hypothetical protein